MYEEPPIFVYADYKAMISEDGTHLPICVCAQTSENNTSYRIQKVCVFFYFTNRCLREYLRKI